MISEPYSDKFCGNFTVENVDVSLVLILIPKEKCHSIMKAPKKPTFSSAKNNMNLDWSSNVLGILCECI